MSNVGINIDALHYETIFGTRTRLVEMIAAGLPVVTSLGAELSYLLRDAGVALTFAVGDSAALGEALARLAADAQATGCMAQAALHYARHDLSFTTTTAPLRAWWPLQRRRLTGSQRGRRLARRLPANTWARSVLRQAFWRFADSDC